MAGDGGRSLSCECALYGEPGSDASSLEPVLESAQLSEVATPLQKGGGERDKYGRYLLLGTTATTDIRRDLAGPTVAAHSVVTATPFGRGPRQGDGILGGVRSNANFNSPSRQLHCSAPLICLCLCFGLFLHAFFISFFSPPFLFICLAVLAGESYCLFAGQC